ncbi:MAG: NADH-quinone oxidoreductase subunit J [bacterium]
MEVTFYIAAAVAVLSTGMVITRLNMIHALLYLVVSLLSVALIFFILGAAFASALEVIIYAGAIMVLFVFAIMMLTFGPHASKQQDHWISHEVWAGPSVLAAILLGELFFIVTRESGPISTGNAAGPKAVGISLFGVYLLGVEIASLILMAGIIGAYHLGRRDERDEKGANP